MSDIPTLRSRTDIMTDLIMGFLSRVDGVDDLSSNSVIRSFFEANAQSSFKTYADIISLVNSLSVDRATGESLQRLAIDANVPIHPARPATGKVNIVDLTFQKVASMVYTGQPAPVAGSLTVNVADASKFKSSDGVIYLGRGTLNEEGPLEYSSVQPEGGGAFWSITLKPTSPTTKFHNVGETVIMGQGGVREIPAGTIVSTPIGNSSSSVAFSVSNASQIEDGEVEALDIPVVADIPGPFSNVAKGAVRVVVGLSFQASCTNPRGFSNGADADSDEAIKKRIKELEQAKSKGTEVAIRALTGSVFSPEEQKQVQSVSIQRRSDSSSELFFDDGEGYEPIFEGSYYEILAEGAFGGEYELQLRNLPVAQARVRNNAKSPYTTLTGKNLAVKVANDTTTHQFIADDFNEPEAPTAFEIAVSISNNPNINFLASTFGNGSHVVIYPKDRNQNSCKVIVPELGNDANAVLDFSATEEVTLRLYKNDEPLYQDGVVARIESREKATWASSVSSGDNLVYRVDGTGVLDILFETADFQAVDPTSIMSYLTDSSIWVEVFNNKMPGITASVEGERIIFTSNLYSDNRASIEIIGGSLRSSLFEPDIDLISSGRESDYTLNKQTGQISLVNALKSGDDITAGSSFTRAKAITSSLPSGTGEAGNVWCVVDGDCKMIPNRLKPSTEVEFSKSSTKLTISSADSLGVSEGFEDIKKGDWFLVWSNSDDPAEIKSNSGYWRVESASQGEVVVDDGDTVRDNLNSKILINPDRIVIVRSDAPMQRLSYTATSLSNFVNEIKSQLKGVAVEIIGSAIRISTLTSDINGELLFVAVDSPAKTLALPVGVILPNVPSHFGFVTTSDSEAGVPNFIIGTIDSVISDTVVTVEDYLNYSGNGRDFLQLLNSFDSVTLNEIPDSNKDRRVFISAYDPQTFQVTLNTPAYMRTGATPIQLNDRFFLRSAYQFDSEDVLTVIVDNDTVTKTFTLPVARKLLVSDHSTPEKQSFSATDVESSLALNHGASFGNFNFKDFLALRRASVVLSNGTGVDDYALRFSSADYGEVGDKFSVGFVYPKNIDQEELGISFNMKELLGVGIILPVSEPRVPNWDHTTSFSIDAATVGGKDTLTYTYRSGLQPNFSATGANVSVGDIAMISPSANFLDGYKDIYAKVVDVTETSFIIEKPTAGVSSDSVVISNIIHSSVGIVVTTATPHGLKNKQRVGLWGTAFLVGTLAPFNGSYIATVTSDTSFVLSTKPSIPSGSILLAQMKDNELIFTTINDHNLQVGSVILIEDLTGFDGIVAVSQVDNAKQFRCVKYSSATLTATGGSFWFQTFKVESLSTSDISTAICDATNGLVTVTTTAPHGHEQNDIVDIKDVVMDGWLLGNTYGEGDIRAYDGTNYVSNISANTGNQPNISPVEWSPTTKSLNGKFIVNSLLSTTKFTYYYNHVDNNGNASGSGGSTTRFIPTSNLARSLGGSSANNLQFGKVETTAIDVVDFISGAWDEQLKAIIYNEQSEDAIIDTSTADLNAGDDYFYGDVTRIETINGISFVKFTIDKNTTEGSDIEISGLTGGFEDYNDNYKVIKTVEIISGSEYQVTVQSKVTAYSTGETSVSGSFVAVTNTAKMIDGINAIYSSDLSSLSGSPMFTVKNDWKHAPLEGDEIRLVALNADHLSRFWNKFIVTGLSSTTKIDSSEYNRQLQITTETFGGSGSVQIAGGSANKITLALTGSASEVEERVGLFTIPYEIRKGLIVGQWIKMANNIRQNKHVQFVGETQLKLHSNGAEISNYGATNATFQTKRDTTQTEATKIRIEKHGRFMAFIAIDGSFGLSTAGVTEGDWVRIKNQQESLWSASADYAIGSRVFFAGENWTALIASGPSFGGNVIPSADSGAWEKQEFLSANQGVFRVVRTFGDDIFWVESDVITEEMVTLGNGGSIGFYSYDSVMPGDTLMVSTTILGAANVGRYVVVDEGYGVGYSFPTPNRIWTSLIPNPSASSSVLGGNYNQVNIEEKEPLVSWKRVSAFGPVSTTNAGVVVDSYYLMNRFSSSNGAYVELQGKMAFNEYINFGVDSYRYYGGLIKELNKVVYGDPSNPYKYPGVRAAGTDIDIKEARIKRVKVGLSLRVRTGVPFNIVKNNVKAIVAGYINSLDVGESVSFSKVIEAAGSEEGVTSVVITYPLYNAANDVINIGAGEKASVINTNTDIIVSILGDSRE